MAISKTGLRIGWLFLVLSTLSMTIACGQGATQTAEPAEDHSDVLPGVVEPKPQGAVQVNVELGEWAVIPSSAEVQRGQIYFQAENIGPNDPHELVVIKTDLAPDQLPNVNGKVAEDQVEMIGEIEEFAVGSKASGVFNLEPGSYVLICNIVEADGESHYLEGMRTAFTVK